MGRASDNGGGGWPHDGGSSDDLPDIPAEWGLIVVPDDLSELSDEVDAIRAELRLNHTGTPWHRFAAGPVGRRLRRVGRLLLRAPVLIVTMAVLVTVASLFASAWPGPPRTPTTQRTANTSDSRSVETLPALELIGPDGRTVALRGRLPAVVLLTDGCDCARLIEETVAAVRPEITVVTVSAQRLPAGPPTSPALGKTVRGLRDPADSLRVELDLGEPDGTAAAVLVATGGAIVDLLPHTASVDDFRTQLAHL